MKAFIQTNTRQIQEGGTTSSSCINVAMHVLGPARTDVRVMREATALVQQGYAVSVVDVEADRGQSVEEEFRGVLLKHIIVSKKFLSTRFSRWPLIRASQILLRSTRRLLQTPADIYHAHDVSGLLSCYIVSLLRRKPLIFDSHELPLDTMTIHSAWILKLLALLLRRIVPYCAGVITVSPPIAQDISKQYRASAVSLIRNIPPYQFVPKSDRLRQYLGLSSNTRIALFQGALFSNRSLEKIVHAASFLDPNIIIALMGPSEETVLAKIEAITSSEGTRDRVKILPPAPYEELLTWTASADIGLIVYPLDESLNIRWCLPNKLFEYLMAGLPVLSSPLDAVSQIVKDNGIGRVVESLEPAAVASSMNAMLSDPAALATMRANALRVAQEEFRWENEGQKLVQLYTSIVPIKK